MIKKLDYVFDYEKLKEATLKTQEWLADSLDQLSEEDWDEMFGKGSYKEDFPNE